MNKTLSDLVHFTAIFFQIIWRVRGIIMLMGLWLVFGAAAITFVEKIPYEEALYFSFITGLTIGYGDIVMKTTVGRVISILIGFIGVVFTGLIVAVAVETVRKILQYNQHIEPEREKK